VPFSAAGGKPLDHGGRFDPKSDVCAAFDKTHLASGQMEHASGVRSPEIYVIVFDPNTIR
jgi:hypothetical protein